MQNFDVSWEEEYSKGNALNKYPFDFVVSLTFNLFGHVEDKAQVKILDVGCGAGNNSVFFAREGFDVYGIDGSNTAIEYIQKIFQEEKLTGIFEQMYFKDIIKIDNKFDLILDRESICTLEWNDVVETYSLISKKLKGDGYFISFFYNKKHPDTKYLKKTDNGHTYYDPENNVFGNSKRVTLFDIESLMECLEKSNLEIIQLYDHNIIPLVGNNIDNGISEYILIAKSTLR